ncbi:hypothetical protein MH117_06250 [Paenibacillus sp. ACRRX]|uniref:hypothetical protein n=1 Tax=Paenibacillus sp. ACRRX TaxID=2918206 RepID=UPI001EF4D267|nr:hypothetical protein [Paenibacillus sp. ACRRX]MCG7407015.1 hypothetical protein [Paenibacillus sp. ACRRX]
MIKRRWGLSGGLLLVLLIMLFVPLSFQPPGNTRMVIDHTLRVYIAPPCFNEADLTNNLIETTWHKAVETGYGPESDCTANKMKPIKRTLWDKVMELTGLIPNPWSW